MTAPISADVQATATELESTLLALAAAGREHDMADPAVIEAMELARAILVNVAIEDTRDKARALLLSSRASLAHEMFRARSGQPAAAWEAADQAPWFRGADADLAAREGDGWGKAGATALDSYGPQNAEAATWFRTGWDAARTLQTFLPDWRDDEIARLRAGRAADAPGATAAASKHTAEVIIHAVLQMFGRLDDKLVRTGLEKPSAVETALEAELGLGNAWHEWWTESGEEYR